MRNILGSDSAIKALVFSIVTSPLFATLTSCDNSPKISKEDQELIIIVNNYTDSIENLRRRLLKNIELENESAEISKEKLRQMDRSLEEHSRRAMASMPVQLDFDIGPSNTDVVTDTNAFLKWLRKDN